MGDSNMHPHAFCIGDELLAPSLRDGRCSAASMPREENGGGKDRGYVQFMSSVILDTKEKVSERDMGRGRELEALRQYKDTLGSLLTLSLASNPPRRDEHKVLSLLTFSTWCCLHCSIHFSKGLSWAAIHVLAHAVVGGPPRKDVKWLS